MRITISGNEIKDMIIDNLRNTFTTDMLNMISKDDLVFQHEVGNDVDGYYMEDSEPFQIVIDDTVEDSTSSTVEGEK